VPSAIIKRYRRRESSDRDVSSRRLGSAGRGHHRSSCGARGVALDGIGAEQEDLPHYGTTFDNLRAGGFRFQSLAGQDAVLGAPNRSGTIEPTALFGQLLEQAGDLKPKHIGIDTAADVFAGNEIDRAQVRQFINLLRRLAIVSDGSVVLLTHPSLTGINTGTGLSGSTAWHNSVRSRMYMTAPKIEAGEQPDTDLREMIFKKSNYGRVPNSLVLRYQNGLFLPEAGLSNIDKAAREAAVEEAFVAIAKKLQMREGTVAGADQPPLCADRRIQAAGGQGHKEG
jgi:AAA domain